MVYLTSTKPISLIEYVGKWRILNLSKETGFKLIYRKIRGDSAFYS